MGKTQLVKTIGKVLDLNFSRIQFTPDLMPADVVGTNIVVKENDNTVFKFEKGPVFTNLLLADEINRATPKTQSALLEAMGEKTVTVGKTTYEMPKPFMVLATQNPIEQEGTYPLPEAQLDRFLFKLNVEFPNLDELKENEFDIIVLDPPAFTKSRRTVQKAYNGYKRINKQAMKVLKNGGYLITCSCSRFMETANFEKMLREAASEAGVVLKQVSVTQQNADHPILWTMEEPSYLKFYIFQII